MDRTYFIAQQVERLDDQAFATFLAWFDRYADLRWAGRMAPEQAGSGAMAIACMAPAAATAHRQIGHAAPRMACEPQIAAWLAHAVQRE
jgi:hypothetical protein